MTAKSLDVVVLLKLLLAKSSDTYAQLSLGLGISASEIHAAVRRSVAAGLVAADNRLPLRKPLEDYLLHGVRYAFPGRLGSLGRGMPTAHAAPPLSAQLSLSDLPPVWPDPQGLAKGLILEPLHPMVPKAAKRDPRLYELLALVDALRVGRARDRKLAGDELKKRLAYANPD